MGGGYHHVDTEGLLHEVARRLHTITPFFRKPHFDSSIQTLGGWTAAGISKTHVTFSANGRKP